MVFYSEVQWTKESEITHTHTHTHTPLPPYDMFQWNANCPYARWRHDKFLPLFLVFLHGLSCFLHIQQRHWQSVQQTSTPFPQRSTCNRPHQGLNAAQMKKKSADKSFIVAVTSNTQPSISSCVVFSSFHFIFTSIVFTSLYLQSIFAVSSLSNQQWWFLRRYVRSSQYLHCN